MMNSLSRRFRRWLNVLLILALLCSLLPPAQAAETQLSKTLHASTSPEAPSTTQTSPIQLKDRSNASSTDLEVTPQATQSVLASMTETQSSLLPLEPLPQAQAATYASEYYPVLAEPNNGPRHYDLKKVIGPPDDKLATILGWAGTSNEPDDSETQNIQFSHHISGFARYLSY